MEFGNMESSFEKENKVVKQPEKNKKVKIVVVTIIILYCLAMVYAYWMAVKYRNVSKQRGINYLHATNGYMYDEEKAFDCFEKAAKLGDKDAKFLAGCKVVLGDFYVVDDSFVYLHKCKADIPYAAMMICDLYGSSSASEKRLLWKEAIEKIDEKQLKENTELIYYAEACLAMAFYYADDDNEAQDYEKAFEWLKLSAEAGSLHAMNMLGYYYESGLGVEKDKDLSEQWYKKAEDKGYLIVYEEFEKKSDKEIVKWYKKLADAGDPVAASYLGDCYYWGDKVDVDDKKALSYFIKGAELGSDYCMYMIGECLYYGYGIKSNLDKAFEWYFKAAENGNKWAMETLAYSYYNEDYLDKDYDKAFEWYLKSYEAGNEDASYGLAQCYYYGQGVKRNYEKAFEYYKESAENGKVEAMKMLSKMYYSAIGTTIDTEKSNEWYNKAEEAEQEEAEQ